MSQENGASREEARRVARETEQALVSALQESDTPGEVLHDELDDAEHPDEAAAGSRLAPPRRRLLGALLLGAVAILVARRRK